MATQNLKSILKRAFLELEAAGIDNAELDARVLLEAAMNKKSAYIFSHPEIPMTNANYAKFRRYIRRRKKGEPVAYILGHKEFYGLDFIVNKNVLIPRPETELLVEEALEYVSRWQLAVGREKLQTASRKPLAILDMGTGSGCIIVSLARQQISITAGQQLKFFATDISRKALVMAKKNSEKHGVKESIKFYCSDLFSNPRLPKKFDLVIANLPYVPGTKYSSSKYASRELPNSSRLQHRIARTISDKMLSFEPESAIFSNQNGTEVIKRFIDQAKNRINNDGLILIELDPRNAKTLFRYAGKKLPEAKAELKKDLAGRYRYLKLTR